MLDTSKVIFIFSTFATFLILKIKYITLMSDYHTTFELIILGK